jgi:tRNA-splicing ligase RtcB
MELVNDKLTNWASDIEEKAMQQALRSSRMPFVDHVAVMPDAHWGMGATVGSVIATRGAIMPAAVGVDIGCGMIAHELAITADQLPDDLASFMPAVSRSIPAGVGRGHRRVHRDAEDWFSANRDRFATELNDKMRAKLLGQFGSLGSGNHFFEICLDESDRVWFVLHSGSRGIGNMLAMGHIRSAKQAMKDRHIHLEDADLAYLEENDDAFVAYVADMTACQDYAMANRNKMMDSVLRAWRDVHPYEGERTVNCHHNFTQREDHGHGEVWITRKGAISARAGEWGVVPGSMGTRSYIVEGLGSPDSFQSSSHGAGRTMSRSRAKRTFSVEDLTAAMEGRVWNADKAQSLVDESPGAYKDIDRVMADQSDLTRPVHTLRQILNYKGT